MCPSYLEHSKCREIIFFNKLKPFTGYAFDFLKDIWNRINELYIHEDLLVQIN